MIRSECHTGETVGTSSVSTSYKFSTRAVRARYIHTPDRLMPCDTECANLTAGASQDPPDCKVQKMSTTPTVIHEDGPSSSSAASSAEGPIDPEGDIIEELTALLKDDNDGETLEMHDEDGNIKSAAVLLEDILNADQSLSSEKLLPGG